MAIAWRVRDKDEPRIQFITEDDAVAKIAEELGDQVTILST